MRVAGWMRGAAILAVLAAIPVTAQTPRREAIVRIVEQRHDATVKALQDWIALPTIAAEKRNVAEGADYMRRLALDAGFQQAKVIPTTACRACSRRSIRAQRRRLASISCMT